MNCCVNLLVLLNKISLVYQKYVKQINMKLRNILINLFVELGSEYKRFEFLKNSGFYIDPVTFIVGQVLEKNKALIPVTKNYTAQYILLAPVLKKILELPDVFIQIVRYMEELQSKTLIDNMMQTNYWREKTSQ